MRTRCSSPRLSHRRTRSRSEKRPKPAPRSRAGVRRAGSPSRRARAGGGRAGAAGGRAELGRAGDRRAGPRRATGGRARRHRARRGSGRPRRRARHPRVGSPPPLLARPSRTAPPGRPSSGRMDVNTRKAENRRMPATRREFLEAGAAVALAASLPPAVHAAASTPRPNFVVLVVDTLRADYVGAYGGRAQTPFIDSLAARGLRFTQFYPEAMATVPARAPSSPAAASGPSAAGMSRATCSALRDGRRSASRRRHSRALSSGPATGPDTPPTTRSSASRGATAAFARASTGSHALAGRSAYGSGQGRVPLGAQPVARARAPRAPHRAADAPLPGGGGTGPTSSARGRRGCSAPGPRRSSKRPPGSRSRWSSTPTSHTSPGPRRGPTSTSTATPATAARSPARAATSG